MNFPPPSPNAKLNPPAGATFAPWKQGLAVAICFVLFMIAIAGVRPLWVDEVLQLISTNKQSTVEMLKEVPQNSGASPLGYLIQHASLRITGFSERNARLPETVFAGAAVFLVALLAAELGVACPVASAVLFAIFPIVIRYATESRVYAPALFFSVLGTLLYVRFIKRPSLSLLIGYTLALIAAVYTQPYAISVGIAHTLWSIRQRHGRFIRIGAWALAVAVLSYLPWFFLSRSVWATGIVQQRFAFSFSLRTLLMIFRELLGSGYWGSGLFVLLCVIGFRSSSMIQSARSLLVLLFSVPLAIGLLGDAWFGYFVAIRQFLWVLPAIAIMGAAALSSHKRAASVLIFLFGTVSLLQSTKYFTNPSENWRAAAFASNDLRGSEGCFTSAPLEHVGLYTFFVPELRQHLCERNTPTTVLAISPYADAREIESSVSTIEKQGYALQTEKVVGRSRIMLLVRRQ